MFPICIQPILALYIPGKQKQKYSLGLSRRVVRLSCLPCGTPNHLPFSVAMYNIHAVVPSTSEQTRWMFYMCLPHQAIGHWPVLQMEVLQHMSTRVKLRLAIQTVLYLSISLCKRNLVSLMLIRPRIYLIWSVSTRPLRILLWVTLPMRIKSSTCLLLHQVVICLCFNSVPQLDLLIYLPSDQHDCQPMYPLRFQRGQLNDQLSFRQLSQLNGPLCIHHR